MTALVLFLVLVMAAVFIAVAAFAFYFVTEPRVPVRARFFWLGVLLFQLLLVCILIVIGFTEDAALR